MAFIKKTWINRGETGATPINATNLNDLEDRIYNGTDGLIGLTATPSNKSTTNLKALKLMNFGANNLDEVFGYGTGVYTVEISGNWYYVMQIYFNDGSGYGIQISFPFTLDIKELRIRRKINGAWSAWRYIQAYESGKNPGQVLTDRGTNTTVASWTNITTDSDDTYLTFVINDSSSRNQDVKVIPIALIKKYTPSNTLIIRLNNAVIFQLAYSNNKVVEYIWTSGYSITHYSY